MDINIEFISSSALEPLGSGERMDYILRSVKENKILVLDGMLSPVEEKALICETMKRINNNFPGIEISTMSRSRNGFRSTLIRMLGGKLSGLTVIGPSKLVKKLCHSKSGMQLLASASAGD